MKCMLFFAFSIFLIENVRASVIPRIVGGANADIKNFPYQVSLRELGQHFCGGIIISNWHILTAAHCVRNEFTPFRDLTVNTDTSSSREIGMSYRVASITVHPGYTGSQTTAFDNDIAVLKLASKMRFSRNSQKIGLVKHNVVSGSRGTLTGWGYTSNRVRVASIRLQQLEMALLTYTHCQPHLPSGYALGERHFCGMSSVGQGSCSGDSGGPLVIANELVGVMSVIMYGECGSGKPNIFSNVYTHRAFIQSAMNR